MDKLCSQAEISKRKYVSLVRPKTEHTLITLCQAFVPEDRLPVAMIGAIGLPVSIDDAFQIVEAYQQLHPDFSVLVWLD